MNSLSATTRDNILPDFKQSEQAIFLVPLLPGKIFISYIVPFMYQIGAESVITRM